ncbi:MAG: hypothetical protein M3Q27_17270 [Actinomycetota bacterium]|nr:hypothetical protein [Actinomycetota bacterium]
MRVRVTALLEVHSVANAFRWDAFRAALPRGASARWDYGRVVVVTCAVRAEDIPSAVAHVRSAAEAAAARAWGDGAGVVNHFWARRRGPAGWGAPWYGWRGPGSRPPGGLAGVREPRRPGPSTFPPAALPDPESES